MYIYYVIYNIWYIYIYIIYDINNCIILYVDRRDDAEADRGLLLRG